MTIRGILNAAVIVGLIGGVAGISGLAYAEAAKTLITQKAKTFSAREITIQRGDAVEFKNDDDTAHNVLSFTPGQEFDLKLQRPGEAKAVTFDTPGRVEVECDIHPKMGLIINVQ